MIPKNQLKEAKELYSENHKTLIKKIKNYMQKWKDIPFPYIGKVNIIKIVIISKEIYRFNAIFIKTPMIFFTELDKKNPKIYRTRIILK